MVVNSPEKVAGPGFAKRDFGSVSVLGSQPFKDLQTKNWLRHSDLGPTVGTFVGMLLHNRPQNPSPGTILSLTMLLFLGC
jgi:hypothetical protein